MSDASKIDDEIRLRAKWNNPLLARRIATFAFLSIVLNLTAWVVNTAALLFNLIATDMTWPLAVVIFCSVWLTIWAWTKYIMRPMGRYLALRQHEEVLKVISEICQRAGDKRT